MPIVSLFKNTTLLYLKAWFIITFFPVLSFSQTVKIKGEFISKGEQYIYLSYFGEKGTVIDSAKVVDEKFIFITDESVDRKFSLSYDNKVFYTFFYSKPVTYVQLKRNVKDSFIKNPSLDQADYMQHEKYLDLLRKQLKNVRQEYNKLYDVYRIEKDTVLRSRYHEILKRLSIEIDSIEEKRIDYEFEYFENNSLSLSSVESLELLLKRKYGRNRFREFRRIYQRFDIAIKKSVQGRRLDEMLRIIEAYHDSPMAKDFSGTDFHEKLFSLSNLRGKSCVLIDFWASWCVPCREDYPSLKEIYKRHQGNVEIVSISIDKNLRNWRDAVVEEDTEWTHISVEANNLMDVRRDYLIISIPVKILIDKNGKIVKRWEGAVDNFVQDFEDVLMKL